MDVDGLEIGFRGATGNQRDSSWKVKTQAELQTKASTASMSISPPPTPPSTALTNDELYLWCIN